jgi:hypothetical protein
VAQVVERLPSNCEDLSSNPNTKKEKESLISCVGTKSNMHFFFIFVLFYFGALGVELRALKKKKEEVLYTDFKRCKVTMAL